MNEQYLQSLLRAVLNGGENLSELSPKSVGSPATQQQSEFFENMISPLNFNPNYQNTMKGLSSGNSFINNTNNPFDSIGMLKAGPSGNNAARGGSGWGAISPGTDPSQSLKSIMG